MNTLAMLTIVQSEPQFFVGWGTLALINAGLAQGKNRSGLGWFLLSVLLGPIATFIVVILDKRPANLTPPPPPKT